MTPLAILLLAIAFLYRPIRVRFGRLVAVEVWPDAMSEPWGDC